MAVKIYRMLSLRKDKNCKLVVMWQKGSKMIIMVIFVERPNPNPLGPT